MNGAISIVLVLLFAVAGGMIGLAVARSRRAHATCTQAEQTDSKTGDRTWVLCLLIGVLCALLVVMGGRISTLSSEIDVLRSDLASARSHLSSQISGISASVRDALEEQATLVVSATSDFGALDLDTATVAMTVTVIPKTLTDDTTLALTVYGGEGIYNAEGELLYGWKQ